MCHHCSGDWRESNQDEKDWSASQSSTIRQPPVRAALCSLLLSFRSQCFLAGIGQQECEVALCSSLLVCWGVSAWSLTAAGCPAQARMGWTALRCTTLHCNAMHWPIIVSPTPRGKRSRSLAPQQGIAAPSCVRRWWLPDGGWRERRRGPLLSIFLSLSFLPLCCYFLIVSCSKSPLYLPLPLLSPTVNYCLCKR